MLERSALCKHSSKKVGDFERQEKCISVALAPKNKPAQHREQDLNSRQEGHSGNDDARTHQPALTLRCLNSHWLYLDMLLL